jgi:hypothetical protein
VNEGFRSASLDTQTVESDVVFLAYEPVRNASQAVELSVALLAVFAPLASAVYRRRTAD